MTTVAAPTQLDAQNPWPGLDAFVENAYRFFHGRDREAAALLSHVLNASVTVLYGRSGLGKTSLLQAGLFPALRAQHLLPIYVRFDLKPDSPPITLQLRECVLRAIAEEVSDCLRPSDQESLWEYLHRADFELWSAQNYLLTPVIVLDQFEEIFTLGDRLPDLVQAFRDDLGDLVENRIPADIAARSEGEEAAAAGLNLRSQNYKVIICLREDFLPELEGWCHLVPSISRSRLRLLPMQKVDALEAVRGPAGHLITSHLARRIVDFIAGRT